MRTQSTGGALVDLDDLACPPTKRKDLRERRLTTCHDHHTHSQITISCVWANMEMTLECEEIHQVTKSTHSSKG